MRSLILSLFAMAAAGALQAQAQQPKVVLIAGKPSHGPLNHEHRAGSMLLAKCLRQNGVNAVVVTGGWPEDEAVFQGAGGIVMFMDGGARHPLLTGERLNTIGALMDKGVGLALLHYAVEIPLGVPGEKLLDWTGGYYERPYSTNPHNDTFLEQGSPDHPISRGWRPFQAKDEWYYRIRFRPGDARLKPILTTMLPKDNPNKETVAWAVERAGGGRGFGFTGLHEHRNLGIDDFRRLLVNAILWVSKVEVPRTGAKCDITPADLMANLDDKPDPGTKNKKKQ
ncbi:MAG: ThuA domain-containing protein [Acidobacteria bacterium]|nr:ThuA domain-containing protein [Acidobacteriota bacterium]